MKKLLLTGIAALFLATGAAHAVDVCMVTDPTGTPLNVRNQPNGEILYTLRNGTEVVWRHLSDDQKWVKIFPTTGRYRDRNEGWVFTDFLDCGYDIRQKAGAAQVGSAKPSRHLVSDCRYSDDTFVEDCWSPNYHRCDVIRFEHNEITGHFELADLLKQKREGTLSKNALKFIPLLRKCEAFYECVAKRGSKWPDGTWVDHAPAPGAPKHCYWPTRDLGPSP